MKLLALSLLGSPAVGAKASKAALRLEQCPSESALLSKSQPLVLWAAAFASNTCVLGETLPSTPTPYGTRDSLVKMTVMLAVSKK